MHTPKIKFWDTKTIYDQKPDESIILHSKFKNIFNKKKDSF